MSTLWDDEVSLKSDKNLKSHSFRWDIGSNGLTVHLYQIPARTSVWSDCWNSQIWRRDTGPPAQQAGWAHICDRDDTRKKIKERKILRVTCKLRASSSALLRHLLKMPKRRRGNCDGAGIPEITDKRARDLPYIPLIVIHRHLMPRHSGSLKHVIPGRGGWGKEEGK